MAQRKRKAGRGGPAPKPQPRPRPQTPATDQASTATVTAEPTVTLSAVTPPAAPAKPKPKPQPAQRKPKTQNEFLATYAQRARERDEEARAKLVPLAPGERPWPIVVSSVTCALLAVANLVLFIVGAKIGHKTPGVGEVLAFVIVMSVCGIGMWVLWFQAVLGFMVLLGILMVYLCLFLVEASNWLGVLYPVVIISAAGFMFWKLIRVLARLQMPERRSRPAGR